MFDGDEIPDPLEGLSDEALAARARALQAERAFLDWEESRLLTEAERRRATAPSPWRDTAAWYQAATGVARSTARSRLEAARVLAQVPMFEAALALHAIGWDHVRIVAEHTQGPDRDLVVDDQAYLLGLARGAGAEEFREQMAIWAAELDDQREAGDTRHHRQLRRRRLGRWRNREGMNVRHLELDDEAASAFDRAVDDVVRDRARAERATGAANELLPIERRRADALVELVQRSRAADAVTRHRARPTILALCDAEVLWDQLKVHGHAHLADGRPISIHDLRRLACEADIIPVICDRHGVPLDMGRSVRLATDDQRLALRAVHGTCAVEGCDVPFDWCEIHHLCAWERHGRTDLRNLVPLCSTHHHLIHDANATVRVLPDRTVRIVGFELLRARPRRRTKPMINSRRPPDRVPARTQRAQPHNPAAAQRGGRHPGG